MLQSCTLNHTSTQIRCRIVIITIFGAHNSIFWRLMCNAVQLTPYRDLSCMCNITFQNEGAHRVCSVYQSLSDTAQIHANSTEAAKNSVILMPIDNATHTNVISVQLNHFTHAITEMVKNSSPKTSNSNACILIDGLSSNVSIYETW
jgi:hypothetical protein